MNTEDNGQKLSALLDEELGYHDSLSLMSRLESDGELSAKLHRYAVVKECMKSGSPLVPDADFVDRVHASLAEEPVVLAPRTMRKPVGEKVATYAIAASMAVIALLVGRSLTDYSPDRAGHLLAQAEMTSPVTQASMEPELRDYLALHNESTYLSGSQGMMPSIRLVSGSVGR
jgi:sigma-E factor negative regulatory protein RseA